MTYINKEKLIREIDKLKVAGAFTEAFKLAVMTVIEHQRAADVEKIVRCKDCECFIPTCETHGVCDLNSSSKAINDFCSEGELKGGCREMTAQEAFEATKLKDIQIEGNAIRVAEFLKGLHIAKEVLEKQIPKRPIDINSAYDGDYGYCPCCNSIIADYTSYKRCKNCGQALDWGEMECQMKK